MFEINDEMIRAVRTCFVQRWARSNSIFDIRSELYKQKYGEYPEIPLWDNYEDEIIETAKKFEEQIWQTMLPAVYP